MLKFNAHHQSSKQAGGGCAVLFGLIFFVAGAAALYFLGGNFLKEAQTYSWDEVPCSYGAINIKVAKKNIDRPFELVAAYSYNYEGRTYESTQLSISTNDATDDYEKLALKRRELIASEVGVCWVDPDDPNQAVLQRKGVSSALFLLFPLPFLAIGGGICYAGIVGIRKKKRGETESISSSAKKSSLGPGGLILLGGIFVIVGAAMAWPLGIRPIQMMAASKSWIETPCEVIWSRVRSHKGDDSTTYSVDIFYRYKFNGEKHRSNRYGFVSGSSSGRSSKQAVVKAYPPKSKRVCFVDPKMPERAVLKQGFSYGALFGLFPLVFFSVGLLILVSGLRKQAEQPTRAFGAVPNGPAGNQLRPSAGTSMVGDEQTGAVTLNPGKGRIIGLAVVTLIAVVWNGVVWTMISNGAMWGDGMGKLFSIPFILVGLALVAAFFYLLGAAMNPKATVTIAPGTPRLGEPFKVQWQVTKGASRLGNLKVLVAANEKATYRRGTNSVTETHQFYGELATEAFSLGEISQGEAVVTLPQDLISSLKLDNNEIEWRLLIQGDIPLWPDVNDSYELTVLPARFESA